MSTNNDTLQVSTNSIHTIVMTSSHTHNKVSHDKSLGESSSIISITKMNSIISSMIKVINITIRMFITMLLHGQPLLGLTQA